METEKLNLVGWKEAVREWVAQKRPKFADEFVQFFDHTFKPITYPEQAYFGVHKTCISLCVGNIWLAGLSTHLWLLVDQPFSVHEFDFELAKATARYQPLYWIKTTPELVTKILDLQDVWNSYANACIKVLESPISRLIIPKNRVNKIKLSDLIAHRTQQFPEEVGYSSDDQLEFPEGGIQEVMRELRQRNPALRKQAIARYGYRCQVCGFSFEDFYGESGRGYIEVHHLTPLSDRETEGTTGIEDVAVVCANCHRVLHRNGKTPISLGDLRNVVKNRRLTIE